MSEAIIQIRCNWFYLWLEIDFNDESDLEILREAKELVRRRQEAEA